MFFKGRLEEKERMIVLLSTQVSDLLSLIKTLQEQHAKEKTELMEKFLAASNPRAITVLRDGGNSQPTNVPVRFPQKPASNFANAPVRPRPSVPADYSPQPLKAKKEDTN